MIDWPNEPTEPTDRGAARAPDPAPAPHDPTSNPHPRHAYVPLGRVLSTPGALRTLYEARVDGAALVARHAAGDWGDVDDHDRAANDRALHEGTRLLSAYHLPNGERLWIITEADRSSTVLLRPDEY